MQQLERTHQRQRPAARCDAELGRFARSAWSRLGLTAGSLASLGFHISKGRCLPFRRGYRGHPFRAFKSHKVFLTAEKVASGQSRNFPSHLVTVAPPGAVVGDADALLALLRACPVAAASGVRRLAELHSFWSAASQCGFVPLAFARLANLNFLPLLCRF